MCSLFCSELHLLVTQASKLSAADCGSVYFSQIYFPCIYFYIFICCFFATLHLHFSDFIFISLVLWYQGIQHKNSPGLFVKALDKDLVRNDYEFWK